MPQALVSSPDTGGGAARGETPRGRVWGYVWLAATGLGLFFSAQIYLSAASLGRPVSWGQAVYWGLGDWYEWALLAPAIFWLCRRFGWDRAAWRASLPAYVAGGLVLASAHAGMCAGAEVLQGWVVGPPATLLNSWRRLMGSRFHFNLAVYAVGVCAWHVWATRRALRDREAQAAQLAAGLAQAQLRMLRLQLNPHFLYNTLNAVSSLMLTDVVAANRMLSRLGALLRAALETEPEQETPLRREIEFLQLYLEVERIRFGDRLRTRFEVDPTALDALVPSLILQPLVENAIRHAVEPRVGPGCVELSCRRERDRLCLRVTDDGPGDSSGASPAAGLEARKDGIGLRNTRERLFRLYGEEQELSVLGNGGGGVTASLRIPFRLARPVAP